MKATKVTIKRVVETIEPGIRLELSIEQAKALMAVAVRVGGKPNETGRKVFSSNGDDCIAAQLAACGIAYDQPQFQFAGNEDSIYFLSGDTGEK